MAGTFSESWYRVANLRVALRPTISFRKHNYRGEEWYVLHDPFTGSYFRLSPAYYDFVARLDFSRTVEELWYDTLNADPEQGPGQQDVITLLMELNAANLIYFQDPADCALLFERGLQKKKQEARQRWLNILFMRFPLVNPDFFLTRLLRVWRVLFSKWGLALWLVVLVLGLKVGIEHAREISNQALNILAPGNLLPLYLGIAMIKIFHEIGHAAMCKRFGGEVNTIGVMFLLFMPLPYVDATSSWSLRNKWQRVLVSSGGMLIELFIGALACIVWASSPPGLVHGLAYNMMFTATVSTLLFNANPLLRFDGYYILVDLIEVPNLFQKSREQVYGLCKKYLFGIHSISPPARSLKEGAWLFLYGTGSMIYRIMLFTWIVLFIADRYFIIGIIIAIIMGSIWFLGPPLKLQKYLLHSPELSGFRSRAIVVSVVALSVPLLFVLLFPFPNGITVPGVVESEHFSDVITESSGIVSKIVTRPGSLVRTGQPLLILENPELDFELRQVLAKIEQITIVEQQTLRHGSVDRVPARKHRSSLMQYLQTLEKQKKSLVIHARQDGIWSFPNVENLTLQWVSKGQNLGRIVNEKTFRFLAVIRQEDASDLFEMTFQKLIVRLKGQGWKNIHASGHDLLPHAQEILPSASLGWNGGGIVPIEPSDTTGTKASEPFYLMHIYLIPSEDIVIKNGQTGRLRLEMPAQSLVLQFFRFLRQFLQKRYQL